MGLTRAIEVLEGAEKAIADLAAAASGQRDYASASLLLGLAQQVAAVRAHVDEGTNGAPSGNGQGSQNSPALRIAAVSAVPAARKVGGSLYPRFKCVAGTLVKVGWSKSERTTYEHRSPREVLDRLIAALGGLAKPGEVFTTEQFMPLKGSDGAELPTYQTYLCLAWLVTIGAVHRHGRQGYSVDNPEGLPQIVEQAWQGLPRR